MSKSAAAIICAAGAGSRFGGKRKKPFVDIEGRAVFLRSVELFAECDSVKQIVLAIAPDDEELVKVKWGANLTFFNVQICFGDVERAGTVSKALQLIRQDIDLVAVHDAARCCVKKQWLDNCLAEAEKTGAAILASPVTDTIKQAENHIVERTIERNNLWQAQTPQIFERELLKNAYAKAARSSLTDDAQLVEALGHRVSIVRADSSNIKITTQSDMAIAGAILKSRRKKPEGPLHPYADARW